ncbi:MAG: aspartate/glutamate racemase family protein [Rhodobacteraceae bacterium]|nr:aspartate/glutamate racemase family protein [Paracoccaceae bacterium]
MAAIGADLMRFLVINPNTSQGITNRISQAAQSAAQPGDRVTTLSAAFGPELIVTHEDGEEAARGVVETIRSQPALPDAIVLASFGDTGAEAVRSLWPNIPVIGIAEAAFETVRQNGGPFAIVTFAPEVAPPLRDKALEHGVGDQLIRVAAHPAALQGDPADVADALFAELLNLCHDCERDGVKAIVMGGGPLAGLAARIAPLCSVPIIDGTVEAIRQIRAQVTTPASLSNTGGVRT